MNASSLLMSLTAFILGCIFTEVRWIARMRGLRGQVGSLGASTQNDSERSGFEDMPQSLWNLRQQLAQEAPVSPLPESQPTVRS